MLFISFSKHHCFVNHVEKFLWNLLNRVFLGWSIFRPWKTTFVRNSWIVSTSLKLILTILLTSIWMRLNPVHGKEEAGQIGPNGDGLAPCQLTQCQKLLSLPTLVYCIKHSLPSLQQQGNKRYAYSAIAPAM